ncbi:MAG: Phytoene desaturase (lycopene-forming) [Alphaproteobacteria bacterium MarineAlpha8_Bin1]|nr:MAG: Phytoene desaturase (lycopene-forming) [Alphaproteobacteria bacterium MarineAlpha8_Bin1]
MTPKDFEKDYKTLNGAGFSISPIFTQSAWFRFHNKSEDFKNLYFVGAGSHPGAGVPGVVSSAKVLENVLKNELKT